MQVRFRNRADAGQQLATRLAQRAWERPVVIGLPRGGVIVAAEVARALDAPLDVLLVRKIGAPSHPEFAVAAVAEGQPPVVELDERALRGSGATAEYVHSQLPAHLTEIERRRSAYLGTRPRAELAGRTAIVVDDGIATGTTVRAAIRALRRRGPHAIVLAVPVAAPDSLAALRPLVDEVVCLGAPPAFSAVGRHYADFDQTPDEEVVHALQEAPAPAAGPASARP